MVGPAAGAAVFGVGLAVGLFLAVGVLVRFPVEGGGLPGDRSRGKSVKEASVQQQQQQTAHRRLQTVQHSQRLPFR